jgi:hypothetical protein
MQRFKMPTIMEASDGLAFAQALEPKLVYDIKDAIPIAGSEHTVYRRLHLLASLGLANFKDGKFQINRGAAMQPLHVIEKLYPSLLSLMQGQRFGKFYNDWDIGFARNALEHYMITLDFKAWELARFQTPSDLYLYVKDVSKAAKLLKESGFSQGKKGRVILLPKTGDFSNKIQRTYLDCIARGGRSIYDAIAIELLYQDTLNVRGHFPIEYILKVQQDMPLVRD